MRNFNLTVAAAAIALSSWSARGHHSAATYFDLDSTMTIEGTVVEWRFTNPHVRLYIDVMAEDGSAERWVAEGASQNGYRRSGTMSEDTFKPGDVVMITGNRPLDESATMINFRSITLEDGSVLGLE